MDVDLTKGKIKSPLRPPFSFFMLSEAKPLLYMKLDKNHNFLTDIVLLLTLSNLSPTNLKVKLMNLCYSVKLRTLEN